MVINFRAEIWRSHVCRVERHHSRPNVFVDLLAVKFDGDKELHAARQAELIRGLPAELLMYPLFFPEFAHPNPAEFPSAIAIGRNPALVNVTF